MAINTEIRATITERAKQFVLFAREVKIITQQIIDDIGLGSIKATDLVQRQNALASVKSNVQSWPHGSLTNADIKGEIVRLWPDTYTANSEVQTDIVALNTAFTDLMAEIEIVLAIARSSGQLYDADPITGLEIYVTVSSPDTDALLILAQTVTDSIN